MNTRGMATSSAAPCLYELKAVTTEATNALGAKVYTRLCSEPTKEAEEIYDKLKYKKMPFRKIKISKSL